MLDQGTATFAMKSVNFVTKKHVKNFNDGDRAY